MKCQRARTCGGNRDQPVVDLQTAAFGANLDRHGIAGCRSSPDDEIDGPFVVLKRADRRRVAVGEIVERPPIAEASIVEQVVVADDPAFDARDAGGVELTGKSPQRAWNVAALADARVTASDDDQVAAERTVFNRRRGHDGRLELMLPPEHFRRRCRRDDFHRRTGHHQLGRVD